MVAAGLFGFFSAGSAYNLVVNLCLVSKNQLIVSMFSRQ